MNDINITIRNIHGIRCGLYSPQMAFEKFTEKQIQKLKSPITLIIDLVIEELMTAVRTCTQKVSNVLIYVQQKSTYFQSIHSTNRLIFKIIFPNLREFLKKEIIKYISKITESAKERTVDLINIEMAYMNTNHLELQKEYVQIKILSKCPVTFS